MMPTTKSHNVVVQQDRVLVVEDEAEIRELIVLQLQRDGYLVEAISSGEEAIRSLNEKNYQLVMLDWMLPGVSGLEIARAIRMKSNQKSIPILIVTARAEPGDIISGLEAGADDYVTKPFDTTVLLARVRALLRRAKLQSSMSQLKATHFEIGKLKINIESHEVYCGEEHVQLTPSEFKLLHIMAANSGRVFTREALIREVQGEGVSVVDRAIDTHIFGLRKKLGDCADVIDTVRGVGYRIKPFENVR